MILTLTLLAVGASVDSARADDGRLANFVLQRGLYVGADFGTFMTFGDTKGVSNLQPFVGLRLGYDLTDNLSLQLTGSAAYVADNPLSDYDDPSKTPDGTGVTSYDLLNVTGEIVYAVRVTERFAIEPKLGTGLSRINPLPTDPNNPALLVSRGNFLIDAGFGFTYLTLLSDFSAGLSATAYIVPKPGIVGLATTFTVRYTF
ncbi:MAG: adventurous gliding motility protein CglE [Clostridia bacterium]|nr:adventurous gliding motility protein CglE [Deltaproteobacteria bacterium]